MLQLKKNGILMAVCPSIGLPEASRAICASWTTFSMSFHLSASAALSILPGNVSSAVAQPQHAFLRFRPRALSIVKRSHIRLTYAAILGRLQPRTLWKPNRCREITARIVRVDGLVGPGSSVGSSTFILATRYNAQSALVSSPTHALALRHASSRSDSVEPGQSNSGGSGGSSLPWPQYVSDPWDLMNAK